VSTVRGDICELSGGCRTRAFEAEQYTLMSGVTTRASTDTGGGQSTASDTGDWIAFGNVTVPKAARYLVEYRIAAPVSNARLSLDINAGATPLGEVTLPNTGGATQDRTVSREVDVPAGTHRFGLYASTGGFDLNWWRLTQVA
jgi:hypothetical protein